MKCDDSRIYLSAYLDDELDVAESLRVQKHLAECRECREAQDQQLALRSALRDPELYAHPSADLSKRLQASLRRAAKEEAQSRRPAWTDLAACRIATWILWMGPSRGRPRHCDYGRGLIPNEWYAIVP